MIARDAKVTAEDSKVIRHIMSPVREVEVGIKGGTIGQPCRGF